MGPPQTQCMQVLLGALPRAVPEKLDVSLLNVEDRPPPPKASGFQRIVLVHIDGLESFKAEMQRLTRGTTSQSAPGSAVAHTPPLWGVAGGLCDSP